MTQDTLSGVSERVRRLRAQVAVGDLRVLANEAEELLQAFERTEAVHVSLGLTDDDFAFTRAQEALGRERLELACEVERLRRRVAPTPGSQGAGRAEIERRLLRVEALARRAPLTTSRDLELIRTGRVGRALAAAV